MTRATVHVRRQRSREEDGGRNDRERPDRARWSLPARSTTASSTSTGRSPPPTPASRPPPTPTTRRRAPARPTPTTLSSSSTAPSTGSSPRFGRDGGPILASIRGREQQEAVVPSGGRGGGGGGRLGRSGAGGGPSDGGRLQARGAATSASSPPSSAAPPSPTPPHPARRRRTTESNSTDMALLMDPGAEPLTEGEKADLDGIAAIKESAAREYKEQGNQFVKMGRKHYADAVDCYTKAIAQMEPLPASAPDPDASVLFANRAHVNLLLGNYRRALDDAERFHLVYTPVGVGRLCRCPFRSAVFSPACMSVPPFFSVSAASSLVPS